jgi:Fic family protein
LSTLARIVARRKQSVERAYKLDAGWLRYFLTAVRETARSAIDQSHAILKLRDAYRKRLARDLRAQALLDQLFINPFTTVASAANALKVTAPTATKTINKLVEAEMLRRTTGGNWGRLWVAQPILRIVRKSLAKSD